MRVRVSPWAFIPLRCINPQGSFLLLPLRGERSIAAQAFRGWGNGFAGCYEKRLFRLRAFIPLRCINPQGSFLRLPLRGERTIAVNRELPRKLGK